MLVDLRYLQGETERMLMCMRGADLAHTACNATGLACPCTFAISMKNVGEYMVRAIGASAALKFSSVWNYSMGDDPL